MDSQRYLVQKPRPRWLVDCCGWTFLKMMGAVPPNPSRCHSRFKKCFKEILRSKSWRKNFFESNYQHNSYMYTISFRTCPYRRHSLSENGRVEPYIASLNIDVTANAITYSWCAPVSHSNMNADALATADSRHDALMLHLPSTAPGRFTKNISCWPSQINWSRRMLTRASAYSKLNWDKKRLIRYVEQLGLPWCAMSTGKDKTTCEFWAYVVVSRSPALSWRVGAFLSEDMEPEQGPFSAQQNQVLEKCSVVSHHLATKCISI